MNKEDNMDKKPLTVAEILAQHGIKGTMTPKGLVVKPPKK